MQDAIHQPSHVLRQQLVVLIGIGVLKTPADALRLAVCQVVQVMAQPFDDAAEVAALDLPIADVHRRVNDGAAGIDFRCTLFVVRLDHFLQVIQVVEIHMFNLRDRFVKVARDGNVDDEQRAVSPAAIDRIEMFDTNDRLG